MVMWVVGPCASLAFPAPGARESAEARTRAARGGDAPRRLAAVHAAPRMHAAHAGRT